MVCGVALLVYSTAELISCFMADLQSDGQTEEMAAVLSLLPAQGLVKEGIKLATHAQALTHRHRQTSGLFLTKMYICIFLCIYKDVWRCHVHAVHTCIVNTLENLPQT